VWYYEELEDREVIGLAHVDNDREVDFGVSRTLHETLRGEHVIVLADDGPERGRAKGDVPPSPTNERSGNDRSTTSKETKDVDKKLGWETIDGPQIASQKVKFCHGTFE
jgi:hypothetical protein